MPILNVGRVVSNPMFAEVFSITRSSGGSWNINGTWGDATVDVSMWGVVQPATAKELEQVPEGDRAKEVKSFHSEQEMFITRVNKPDEDVTDPGYSAMISDVAVWNCQKYRLVKRFEWDDFGYYKALGVRIEGQ
jgi:hypothetical protein